MPKILIVIPAYNEEQTIEAVVRQASLYADVCVVDDASKDQTAAILTRLRSEPSLRLQTLAHEKNLHIPKTMQDAMKLAVRSGYDYVIGMDAGLSHDPRDLQKFLNAAHCDLLIGVRTQKLDTPIFRRVVSRFGTELMNFVIKNKNEKLRDSTSGFRRYSKTAIQEIASRDLQSKSFDFHLETLFIAKEKGWSIGEVEISYRFTQSSLNRRVLWDVASFIFKKVNTKIK